MVPGTIVAGTIFVTIFAEQMFEYITIVWYTIHDIITDYF